MCLVKTNTVRVKEDFQFSIRYKCNTSEKIIPIFSQRERERERERVKNCARIIFIPPLIKN